MTNLRILFALTILIGATASAFSQTVRRVPAQYATVQAAIDAARDGDRVEVAPGRYIENIDFSGKTIAVVSTGGPRQTILDGGGVDTVVRFYRGEGPGTLLEGFTITGGSASYGGGIFCTGDAAPLILGNRIVRNVATTEGGGVLLGRCTAILRANEITENRANNGAGVAAIGDEGTRIPVVDGNRIFRNLGSFGVGCFVRHGHLVNNWIYRNRGKSGVGVYMTGTAVVTGNTIVNNIGTGGDCGVLESVSTNSFLINCIISGNSSVYTSQIDPNPANNMTVSHCAIDTGHRGGQNIVTTRARFIDPDNDDYHLRADSPLRDLGDPNAPGLPATDVDGNPRVVGSGVDIGADEVGRALYARPERRSGEGPVVCVTGQPGDTVFWTSGSGVLATPVVIPNYGSWFLRFPIQPLNRIAPLTGAGFASVDLTIPPAHVGTPLALQALFVAGTAGQLSPPFVLRDTAPYRIRRVPSEYATIQSAVDAAQDDEVVAVAPGSYRETVDLRGKAVYLRSTGGAYVTTIDAYRGGPVVNCASGESESAVIAGFTLTNGWGGVRCNGQYTRPTIIDNRIVANGNCGVECLNDASPIVKRNYIANNNANYGGGLLATGFAFVEANEIVGNTADYGGGLHLRGAIVIRNRIHRNHGRIQGGGIYVAQGNLLSDNLVYRNTGQDGGGAYFAANASCSCLANTFANNLSTLRASVVFDRSRITLNDNVIWPDSTFPSPLGGAGNFFADPTYADPANDDYHLTAGSAAIDAGGAVFSGTTSDFEGDARAADGKEDSGADERGLRLYQIGAATPGGAFSVRVIGDPASRVVLGIGSGVRPVAEKIPGVGFLELDLPILPIDLGPMPPSGVLVWPVTLPAAFPLGPIPLQAVVGSTLSNLHVVEVR